jgi:acetyltransferase-like isoleucine patch superfamily enzyme
MATEVKKWAGQPNIHSRKGKAGAGELIVGHGVAFLGSGVAAPDIDISGTVEIGDFSLVDRHVKIITHRHPYEHTLYEELSQHLRGETSHPLKIGKAVLLCERATILPQVDYIGDYAIIGLGAVLTKNVEPYEVWAGNPARKVGERKEKPA